MSKNYLKIQSVISEVNNVVVGQEYMIKRLLMGLFTQGHILLEGVPGLAKTLTVNTLSSVLKLNFKRIQFTPDLLPSDVIGTMIYNQKKSSFEVKKGPVFSNIILADEINRSPAKVQSALLESMQEKQVTIGDDTYKLDLPFLVLATQNPIDQEGTYPLPEAQRDRFMMKLNVDYPSKEEELKIMQRMADLNFNKKTKTILNKKDITTIQNEINKVSISESIEKYIIEIVNATRKPSSVNLNELDEFISFGASPRASINLSLASKANAFLSNRDYVMPDDIKEIAQDVLNHRIILNYEAEAEGIKPDFIIKLKKSNHKFFLNFLEERIGNLVGEIVKINSTQIFPLSAHINDSFVNKRLIYVGDSAHSIHPIAGQGWNLGVNDVKNLHEVCKKYNRDIGSQRFCDHYNDLSYNKAFQLFQITDKLDWHFKNNSNLYRLLSYAGFKFIENKNSIKNEITKYAMGV